MKNIAEMDKDELLALVQEFYDIAKASEDARDYIMWVMEKCEDGGMKESTYED